MKQEDPGDLTEPPCRSTGTFLNSPYSFGTSPRRTISSTWNESVASDDLVNLERVPSHQTISSTWNESRRIRRSRQLETSPVPSSNSGNLDRRSIFFVYGSRFQLVPILIVSVGGTSHILSSAVKSDPIDPTQFYIFVPGSRFHTGSDINCFS